MIPVTIGGEEIVIKPKRLLDYVEKIDFIKSRRRSPFDLLSGIPKQASRERMDDFMRIAMQVVYTASSSVTFDEELSFDRSEEGFYYDLWRAITPLEKEGYHAGINRAMRLWQKCTDEEKEALLLALKSTDEMNLVKN